MKRAMYAAGAIAWLFSAILFAVAFFAVSGGGNVGSVSVEVSTEVRAVILVGQIVTVASALLIVGTIFICAGALNRRSS